MRVEIIARPAGEAPEWVRDAWIGLRLPLRHPDKRAWRATGVLTGPRSYVGNLLAMVRGRTERTPGYLVDARAAVDILSRANPAAATWWRDNVPHVLDQGGSFVFEEGACRSIES